MYTLSDKEKNMLKEYCGGGVVFWNVLKELMTLENKAGVSHYSDALQFLNKSISPGQKGHRRDLEGITARWMSRNEHAVTDAQMNWDLAWVITQLARTEKIQQVWNVDATIKGLFPRINGSRDYQQPMNSSVERSTVFKFAITCHLNYEETKQLLQRGAVQDECNPRRFDEVLYMYAINKNLNYHDGENEGIVSLLKSAQNKYLKHLFGDEHDYSGFVDAVAEQNGLLFNAGNSSRGAVTILDASKLDHTAVSYAVYEQMARTETITPQDEFWNFYYNQYMGIVDRLLMKRASRMVDRPEEQQPSYFYSHFDPLRDLAAMPPDRRILAVNRICSHSKIQENTLVREFFEQLGSAEDVISAFSSSAFMELMNDENYLSYAVNVKGYLETAVNHTVLGVRSLSLEEADIFVQLWKTVMWLYRKYKELQQLLEKDIDASIARTNKTLARQLAEAGSNPTAEQKTAISRSRSKIRNLTEKKGRINEAYFEMFFRMVTAASNVRTYIAHADAVIRKMAERYQNEHAGALDNTQTVDLIQRILGSFEDDISGYLDQMVNDFHFYQEYERPWLSVSACQSYADYGDDKGYQRMREVLGKSAEMFIPDYRHEMILDRQTQRDEEWIMGNDNEDMIVISRTDLMKIYFCHAAAVKNKKGGNMSDAEYRMEEFRSVVNWELPRTFFAEFNADNPLDSFLMYALSTSDPFGFLKSAMETEPGLERLLRSVRVSPDE